MKKGKNQEGEEKQELLQQEGEETTGLLQQKGEETTGLLQQEGEKTTGLLQQEENACEAETAHAEQLSEDAEDLSTCENTDTEDTPPPTPLPSGVIRHLENAKLLSESEQEQVGALLDDVLNEWTKGSFSDHTLQCLSRAVNYERDITQAKREGEIKGRNLKIEEYLIERRSAEEMRQLGSTPISSRPTPPQSVIGGLSAADRKSIWERGHEKRVCHH